jgi:tellurite resistance protein TerC
MIGEHPTWIWVVFGVLVAILLAIDLFTHRGEHGQSRKAAIVWSIVWVGVGLAFGLFVWVAIGGTAAGEYYAAYLIEKSLSVDNLFVFLLIFQTLAIPHHQQHRVLVWGIFGALVFRAIFIFLGVRALEQIDWMVYVFAAILLFAAFRIVREDPRAKTENKTVKWLARHLPITHEIHEHRFISKVDGRTVATPLLVAVIALETTDIMFAVDSIPAALSVTRDELLVYSSNAFAILGLRALYLVMADLVARLEYLHYGLAAVLAFAAVKLLTADLWHVPPWLSIGIIVLLLGAAVVASLLHKRPLEEPKAPDLGEPA